MFIRRNLAVLLLFVSLLSNAQIKKPTAHLGVAHLSSATIVSELPPDMPDTTTHFRNEPNEPDEKNPLFRFHKRRLPNKSWNNFYEDLNPGGAMNKTNASGLTIGAQAKYSIYTLGTPPDNAMAISNNGKIIAAINVKVGFYDSTGARLIANERDMSIFIGDAAITQADLFDPRVVYDPKADRFIFVVLSGSTDVDSKIVIGFSQTNDPLGAWKFYKINGNVDGSQSWFDYPNIAITDNELIISGNLFYSPSNNFYQSVVLQINKSEGYAGGANLNYKYWDGITDASGGNAFTLVPAVNGTNKSYGPNSYLVSSTTPGSNLITLFEITNVWNSPTAELKMTPIVVDQYSTPTSNAPQKGTTKRLDIQKSRIRNAYFANGIVHYAYVTPTNTFGSVSAIAYGRYDVATATNKMIYVGATNFNFAYPAIMHFSNLEDKNKTLLTYLASNATIYPEIRAISVDEKMIPSTSVVLKAGVNFVNYSTGSAAAERWGDYTGIARKYNSVRPEVWVFGCYGETNNRWGNYISQLVDTPDAKPATFVADTFYFSPNPTMRFLDLNVSASNANTYHVQIYSLKGQLVFEETTSIPAGERVKTYDLLGLSPAEYVLKLYAGEIEIKTTKIVLLGK